MRKIDKQYWEARLKKLDLGRSDTLKRAQAVLDGRYPRQARAKSLNDAVLKIVTPSAVIASELRLHQVALLEEINATTTDAVAKLQIQIGQL